MDASPSPSSSPAPQQQQHNHQHQTASKKIRFTPVSSGTQQHHDNALETPLAVQLLTSPDQVVISSPPPSLDALPPRMLSEIGEFAAGGGGSFSGASKSTLEAIREVHLKMDEKFETWFPKAALITPTGALKSGRVVAHITTTAAIDPWESEVRVGGLESTVKITTLQVLSETRNSQLCENISGLKAMPRVGKQ